MEKPIYQIRLYCPDDYPLFDEWHNGHGKCAVSQSILPKLGVVVLACGDGEPLPVAFLFLYMDNSVGVSFLDHIVTRPGLSVSRARKALLWGMLCLRKLAAEMDYGIMICHTLPAIARFLGREGWHSMAEGRISMISLTRQEENNGN